MIRIATRNSALAKTQAGQVAALLGGGELVEVVSDGEVGDKARFVRGVERALLAGEADIGVHSAKDLPGEMAEGLTIVAVPVREDPADVWIAARGGSAAGASSSSESAGAQQAGGFDGVPEGARVGTASLRRRAQLLAVRPDLEVSELHGNVDTRLRKLAAGEHDAIVLAAAGLRRLGRADEVSFSIPAEVMTPAAGQGALVLQAREDDAAALEAAAEIGDETALRELTAERAVVGLLEATCATPIGVHARIGDSPSGENGRAESLVVESFVGLPDGSEWIRDRVEGDAAEPAAAGALLAERLLSAGARDILDRAEAL
ncbi:MAG: hydroxymethylbilane synthase [Solirubrobacterales bacterium]